MEKIEKEMMELKELLTNAPDEKKWEIEFDIQVVEKILENLKKGN